jgi:hypothetical protein
MTPDLFLRLAVEPALSLLPESLRSTEAKAFLVAIALQESRLTARRQIGGPAHGYHQFELGGVEAVWNHETTKKAAREICKVLDVAQTPLGVWAALEFHDVLDCVFARLLLMTIRNPLPARDDTDESYRQYLVLWRPGKPRSLTWTPNYLDAWTAVQP